MPDEFLWCSLCRYEVASELPLRFRPGGHISPVYHCPQLPRTKDIEKDQNIPKDVLEDEDKTKEKEDILGSFKIDSEDSDEYYD